MKNQHRRSYHASPEAAGELLGSLTWPFVFGPLHDALLEDALDKADAALTGKEWRPRMLPAGVRLLRAILARRGKKR